MVVNVSMVSTDMCVDAPPDTPESTVKSVNITFSIPYLYFYFYRNFKQSLFSNRLSAFLKFKVSKTVGNCKNVDNL